MSAKPPRNPLDGIDVLPTGPDRFRFSVPQLREIAKQVNPADPTHPKVAGVIETACNVVMLSKTFRDLVVRYARELDERGLSAAEIEHRRSRACIEDGCIWWKSANGLSADLTAVAAQRDDYAEELNGLRAYVAAEMRKMRARFAQGCAVCGAMNWFAVPPDNMKCGDCGNIFDAPIVREDRQEGTRGGNESGGPL